MSYKTSIIVSITCFLLLLAWALHPLVFFMISMSDGPPRRGKHVDSWQTTNNRFKIRVTAYEEEGAYLAGTYYGFESASFDTDSWQEFMVFRHDDRPDILREQVRFVTDNVAYAFMGNMYAVTTDGGKSWGVINMKSLLADEQSQIYGQIQGVQIDVDGRGKLLLYEGIELKTTDYGRQWNR